MIREAGPGDAARIAEIWNWAIRETAVTFNSHERSADDVAGLVAQRQSEGTGFWVIEPEGQVVGFATYFQFRGGPGYARTMEHTIILAPESAGRGLGRALLNHVEDHARAAGVHSLFAGVSGENEPAIAFHCALGYDEVAILRQVGHKFGRFMDLHLLQKFL